MPQCPPLQVKIKTPKSRKRVSCREQSPKSKNKNPKFQTRNTGLRTTRRAFGRVGLRCAVRPRHSGRVPKICTPVPRKKQNETVHPCDMVAQWPTDWNLQAIHVGLCWDMVGICFAYICSSFFPSFTLLLLDLFGFIDWLLENWKWQLWRHQKSSTHLKTHLKHKNIKGPHVVQHTNLSL